MNEERAHEVVEHLQAAALELIEAARAALDVAEELVKDPADALVVATALANKLAPPGPPHDGEGPRVIAPPPRSGFAPPAVGRRPREWARVCPTR